MASTLVRTALHSLSQDKKYVESTKLKSIKAQSSKILDLIIDDEKTDVFDEFASNLYDTLKNVVISSMPLTSSKVRQAMWMKYHKIRSTKLVGLWKKFTTDMEINDISVMLTQIINDQLFQELIKHHTTIVEHDKPSKPELSTLEETILRYATGFIPCKLIKRFKLLKGPKYAIFVECLLHLHVSDHCDDESIESSFLDYTKHWTNIVNRGGLFETNDQCFMLFKEIERTLQPKLQSALLDSARATEEADTVTRKETIIHEVVSDDDVGFYWSLCSVYIPDEEISCELLTQIVELWLTIRGFSLAKEWVEKHKWEKKKSTAKTKSLRKKLKESYDTSTKKQLV